MGVETNCISWDNDEAISKFHVNYFYPVSVLDKELILEKYNEIGIYSITTIATDICILTMGFKAEKMKLEKEY